MKKPPRGERLAPDARKPLRPKEPEVYIRRRPPAPDDVPEIAPPPASEARLRTSAPPHWPGLRGHVLGLFYGFGAVDRGDPLLTVAPEGRRGHA